MPREALRPATSERRLRLIAGLVPKTLRILEKAASPSWTITFREPGQQFQRLASSGAFDVALLDVSQAACEYPQRLESWIDSLVLDEIPVVLVGDASRRTIDSIIAQCRRHDCLQYAVLLPGDRFDQLAPAIEAAISSVLGQRVFNEVLRGKERKLSDASAHVLRTLYRSPSSCRTSSSVISLAGKTVTAINMELRQVGLGSYRVHRRAAHVTHAYSLSHRRGITVSQLARTAGCGSVDTLARDVKAITGLSVRAMVTNLSKDELIQVVAAYAVREVQG